MLQGVTQEARHPLIDIATLNQSSEGQSNQSLPSPAKLNSQNLLVNPINTKNLIIPDQLPMSDRFSTRQSLQGSIRKSNRHSMANKTSSKQRSDTFGSKKPTSTFNVLSSRTQASRRSRVSHATYRTQALNSRSHSKDPHKKEQQAKSEVPPTIAQLLTKQQEEFQALYLASMAKCALEIPKMIRFGSKGDSIEEVRLKMMRNLFDHRNFDVFLSTPFGKYLLDGIGDDETIQNQGITKVSEYIATNKTFYTAIKRAKLDLTLHAKNKRTKNNSQNSRTQQDDDPSRFTRSTKNMLAYYDKILEDTVISLEETRKIQETCRNELERIRYSVKTKKPQTFEQINKMIEVSGPPRLVKHDEKKQERRDKVIFQILTRMFQQLNLPWTELTIENMRSKVDLLHTVKKEDVRFMKMLGPGQEIKNEEPKVYKTRLEQQLARKKENESCGGSKLDRSPLKLERQATSMSQKRSPRSSASPTLRSKAKPQLVITSKMFTETSQNASKNNKVMTPVSPFIGQQKRLTVQKSVQFVDKLVEHKPTQTPAFMPRKTIDTVGLDKQKITIEVENSDQSSESLQIASTTLNSPPEDRVKDSRQAKAMDLFRNYGKNGELNLTQNERRQIQIESKKRGPLFLRKEIKEEAVEAPNKNSKSSKGSVQQTIFNSKRSSGRELYKRLSIEINPEKALHDQREILSPSHLSPSKQPMITSEDRQSTKKRLMSASHTRIGHLFANGSSQRLFSGCHQRTVSGHTNQQGEKKLFEAKKFSAVLAINREASKTRIRNKGFLSATNQSSRQTSATRLKSEKQTAAATEVTKAQENAAKESKSLSTISVSPRSPPIPESIASSRTRSYSRAFKGQYKNFKIGNKRGVPSISINIEQQIASGSHLNKIFEPIEGENLKRFEQTVRTQSSRKNEDFFTQMLQHGFARQSTMQRRDTFAMNSSMSSTQLNFLLGASRKGRSKTKVNLMGKEDDVSGISTDELSSNEESLPKPPSLGKKGYSMGQRLSRRMSMTDASVYTSYASKIDTERAQQSFDNHQRQKQVIMDVCEKRNKEVQKLLKHAQGQQPEFDKIYEQHEDLNSAVDKIITNEELYKPPHNLPNVQKVMDDTAFGLLNDQKNLQSEKELEKFRGNNKQVSLFLWKQGRQSTWMPDKMSYIGFDNLTRYVRAPQPYRQSC